MVFLTHILRNQNVEKAAMDGFRKWIFNQNIHNRYGLYSDDIIEYDFRPEVMEAVRRLPEDVLCARNYRFVRAIQLNIQKDYLPKDQWITYEEDQTEGKYLTPYINEVLAEWKEKLDWENKYNC